MTLILKYKWFDMVASGNKKEKYREVKPYYGSRLFKWVNSDSSCIEFRRGYTKTTINVTCLGYWLILNGKMLTHDEKLGLPELRKDWGFTENKSLIIFKLGKINWEK